MGVILVSAEQERWYEHCLGIFEQLPPHLQTQWVIYLMEHAGIWSDLSLHALPLAAGESRAARVLGSAPGLEAVSNE